jgi:hypothetical protein
LLLLLHIEPLQLLKLSHLLHLLHLLHLEEVHWVGARGQAGLGLWNLRLVEHHGASLWSDDLQLLHEFNDG